MNSLLGSWSDSVKNSFMRKASNWPTYQSLDPTTNFETTNPEFLRFFKTIRLFLTKQNEKTSYKKIGFNWSIKCVKIWICSSSGEQNNGYLIIWPI